MNFSSKESKRSVPISHSGQCSFFLQLSASFREIDNITTTKYMWKTKAKSMLLPRRTHSSYSLLLSLSLLSFRPYAFLWIFLALVYNVFIEIVVKRGIQEAMV